jgi:hypothetical protein
MSSIFISYSSKDRSAAEEMYKRLTEKGYQSPFLDYQADSGIRAGADWERELYQHLKICKALIVLCSENWRQSQWSFAEVVYARCMGKDIFPVKISKCEIHPILGNLQVVDLEKEGQLGYERLWHGLEAARLSSQEDFEFDANRPPYPGLMAFDERDSGGTKKFKRCLTV